MMRALLISTVSHAVVFTAFAVELNIPLFTLPEPDPIEVEIVFEEEKIEVSDTAVIEDFSDPQPLDDSDPERVAEPVAEDGPPDPLFLPETTENPDLPEGLDEFIEQDAVPEADTLPEPANDQSPDESDFAEDDGDALADLISEITDAATDEAADEDDVFVPAYPKPRPRALPVHRDLAEEAREAEAAVAAEAAESAAQAEADEQAAADQREAEARQRAAKLRSSDYVQSCVNGEWNYPLFIRYPREWQVSFTLSLDQNGDIAEVERGSVAAEDNATDDQLSAFVQSAESALYSCEPFLNPSGASNEAFEIEVVMQPRSAF